MVIVSHSTLEEVTIPSELIMVLLVVHLPILA